MELHIEWRVFVWIYRSSVDSHAKFMSWWINEWLLTRLAVNASLDCGYCVLRWINQIINLPTSSSLTIVNTGHLEGDIS